MRSVSLIIAAIIVVAAMPGCSESQDDSTDLSPDIAARLSAEDRCVARGYTVSSKEYSDCFFKEFHQYPGESSSIPQPPVTTIPPEVAPNSDAQPQEEGLTSDVAMRRLGGTYIVPVSINGRLTLDFVVDSGAADVSIPADVVLTLIRTGTLEAGDFVGHQTYVLADGSKVPSLTFRIRDLKVGGNDVRNVLGSIAPVSGTLLLGQSFLGRFKSWSIDNYRHVLVLK
jgi:hypothetical protein